MKTTLAITIFVSLLFLSAAAQTAPAGSSSMVEPGLTVSSASPDLDAILGDLQQWTVSAGRSLAALRIEKWKTDNAQKLQMEKAISSLQRNLATILPGPANDLRLAPGSAAKSFKLYQNINLVYEFLGSVADAAASFGRPEESEPLTRDTAALDKLRRRLSQYTEQSAARLEANLQEAKAQQASLETRLEAAQSAALRKVVIDDPASAKKPRKANKKISAVVAPGAANN
jgi:hypothetical protein